MEIDIVAESVDGKTLLLGEAKLKLTAVEAEHEMRELKKKASLLPFVRDYKRVLCRLFVAENPRKGDLGMEWVLK